MPRYPMRRPQMDRRYFDDRGPYGDVDLDELVGHEGGSPYDGDLPGYDPDGLVMPEEEEINAAVDAPDDRPRGFMENMANVFGDSPVKTQGDGLGGLIAAIAGGVANYHIGKAGKQLEGRQKEAQGQRKYELEQRGKSEESRRLMQRQGLIERIRAGLKKPDPTPAQMEEEAYHKGRGGARADREFPKPATPKDERLVQIAGPNGTAVWVRESEAVGKPAAQAARSVTGQERQGLAYFNRAKDAIDTITKADKAGDLETRIAGQGLVGQVQGKHAPNMMQTADQQVYRQAQRAFTEARLRKESGAAIPIHEFDSDSKTYFAEPGDSKEVIESKRRARQVVLDGLKFSSGRAYDEFYGDQPPASGEKRVRFVRGADGKLQAQP